MEPQANHRRKTAASKKRSRRKRGRRFLLYLFILVVLAAIPAFFIGRIYYQEYSLLIDTKLAERREGIHSGIYATPEELVPRKKMDLLDLVHCIERIGFRRADRLEESQELTYQITDKDVIRLHCPVNGKDPDQPNRIEVHFSGGAIQSLVSLPKKISLSRFTLPAELLTNVSISIREKRKLVRLKDLPPYVIRAILASEDKRFYSHFGLDPIRIVKAFFVNTQAQEVVQGGSTLTQQFVKNFFLSQDRIWKRKLKEAVLALMLEWRLSKDEILELYLNDVYLGQRASFGIVGIGEAADAFFSKQAKDLTISEAAMLASCISAPNRFNPYRHSDLVLRRRNILLDTMEELGYISPEAKVAAKSEALNVKPNAPSNYSSYPYFVDFIADQLDQILPEGAPKQYFRIYTTLDTELQRAAFEAMRLGLIEVDERLKNSPDKIAPGTIQSALLALDPTTGNILAFLGGRNYSSSQYNRVTEARRQPGSIFKPFVYAAALETYFWRPEKPITIASNVVDRPDVFETDIENYMPKNYKEQYEGLVNLRRALSRSLNIATIKVAEMTGLDKVVELAISAGLPATIRPFPSMPLGTFEVTLLEIAKAYTAFLNGGQTVEPHAIREILDPEGKVVYQAKVQWNQAFSPETAYLITNILETTINNGTGASARARGFILPAAGKTGTSFDGWFAGFTPDLLCIVWVGFDDNRPLGLSGAQSALPIWTEFMKRAQGLIPLRPKQFVRPENIVEVEIDPVTGMLATPRCIEHRPEIFIKGTEPTVRCKGTNYERMLR